MNVRLAADNAGTVRKKFGKTSFCDSSPEAADGETCGEWKPFMISILKSPEFYLVYDETIQIR